MQEKWSGMIRWTPALWFNNSTIQTYLENFPDQLELCKERCSLFAEPPPFSYMERNFLYPSHMEPPDDIDHAALGNKHPPKPGQLPHEELAMMQAKCKDAKKENPCSR